MPASETIPLPDQFPPGTMFFERDEGRPFCSIPGKGDYLTGDNGALFRAPSDLLDTVGTPFGPSLPGKISEERFREIARTKAWW